MIYCKQLYTWGITDLIFWATFMEWDCIIFLSDTDIDRMGATASREAMRMPISQIPAVSRRAQVGSPLAFPWPNTYEQMQPSVNVEARKTRNWKY